MAKHKRGIAQRTIDTNITLCLCVECCRSIQNQVYSAFTNIKVCTAPSLRVGGNSVNTGLKNHVFLQVHPENAKVPDLRETTNDHQLNPSYCFSSSADGAGHNN